MICDTYNRLVLLLSSGRRVVTCGKVSKYFCKFILQICNTNSLTPTTCMGLFFFFFDSQDGSGFIADDEIDALIHDLLKRKGEVS